MNSFKTGGYVAQEGASSMILTIFLGLLIVLFLLGFSVHTPSGSPL